MRSKTDKAVSNIVGAVLILALIIAVAAAARMVYVPDMKKESESAHMQNAIDDMQNIKTQVSTMQAASVYGNGFTTTSPLEMGGGSLPVIDPSSSSGTIAVDPAYGSFSIVAYSNNMLLTDNNSRIFTRGSAPMGRLVYLANNHYYTDQIIGFEAGMLVLSQSGGHVMISSPPISVTRGTDNNTTAVVMANPQRIAGSPQSLSSTSDSAIRTTVQPLNNVINSNKVLNVTITVKSDNADLWQSYFNQIMTSSGLVNITNYKVTRLDAQTVSLWVQGSGIKDDVVLSSIDSLVTTQIDGGQPPITPPVNTTATPVPGQTYLPVASIVATPLSGDMPLNVSFLGSGTNSPTSFDWDFGDGTAPGSGASLYHTYNTSGNYTVKLIARNAIGASAPATALITVKIPVSVASINATPLSGDAPLTVSFRGNGTNSPTSFVWTFGDGSDHGSGANVTHTYTTPGIYQVVLVVRNAGGDSAPVVATIRVSIPLPVASIKATPTSGTAPLTVNFQGSGTNSPTSYDWDFGDGSPHGSGASVSHTYATSDTYTATLVVRNAGGDSAPATAQITVNKPVATEPLYLTQSGTMSTSVPSGGTTTIYFPVLGLYQTSETWKSPVFATDYTIEYPADTYLYTKNNGILTLINSVSAKLEIVSDSGARTTVMSADRGGLLTLELIGDDVSILKMSRSQQGPITAPKGSHLELTVYCYSLLGLSSLNVYEGSTYPSRVSMSTPTYISVSDLVLSDTNGTSVSSVPQSGTLRIGATVTDPFGTSDIKGVTLTVYSPSGSTIYGPTSMTPTATGTGSPAAWNKYQDTVGFGTGPSKGMYTVVVKATDTSGIVVSKTLQIPAS